MLAPQIPLAIASTLLLWTLLSSLALAQLYQPFVTYRSANAYADDQFLFVVGGAKTQQSTIQQTFMLDLSSSWTTAQPNFTQLPELTGVTSTLSGGAATVTVDRKKVLVQYGSAIYTFDVASRTWDNAGKGTTSANINTHGLLSAVTNPVTGVMYIPNGYMDSATSNSLLSINPNTTALTRVATTGFPPTLEDYAATWNAVFNSMFVFGGVNASATTGSSDIFQYDPSSGWKVFDVSGLKPPPRRNPCFVSVFRGTKMVLFGGYAIPSGDALADIYILDIATMAWRQYLNATAVNARGGAACGAGGEGFFVAWGGSASGSAALAGDPVVVFNVRTTSWVKTYKGNSTSSDGESGGSGNGNGNGSSSKGSNNSSDAGSKPGTPVIVGAIGGGLVLFTAAVGIGVYRYRSKRNKLDEADESVASTTENNPHGEMGPDSKNGSTARLRGPAYISPFAKIEDQEDEVPVPLEPRRVRGPAAIRSIDLHAFYDSGPQAAEVEGPVKMGRLQEGEYGARPMSQHPQGVPLDGMKHGPQGEAYGAFPTAQNPQGGAFGAHAFTTVHNPHAVAPGSYYSNQPVSNHPFYYYSTGYDSKQ
ncbi:hypothetical protein B0O80DRAFT_440535 [Mortierella sp. GBAus27b]|nr:hypothetical protein BGX31_003627 [Mortierella sp. GBA43]KAI8359557.1 hypothetical protein B0O80DRAFT_440535 [Mortierella sp. GBAus27b]